MSLSVEGFQSAFRYAEMFWQGLVCTLALSALTVLFGFIFALLLAHAELLRILQRTHGQTVHHIRDIPLGNQPF